MNNINILPLCSPSGAEARYGLESVDSVINLTFYMGPYLATQNVTFSGKKNSLLESKEAFFRGLL